MQSDAHTHQNIDPLSPKIGLRTIEDHNKLNVQDSRQSLGHLGSESSIDNNKALKLHNQVFDQGFEQSSEQFQQNQEELNLPSPRTTQPDHRISGEGKTTKIWQSGSYAK